MAHTESAIDHVNLQLSRLSGQMRAAAIRNVLDSGQPIDFQDPKLQPHEELEQTERTAVRLMELSEGLAKRIATAQRRRPANAELQPYESGRSIPGSVHHSANHK